MSRALFTDVRDVAVQIGRAAAPIALEDVDEAIRQAERAQAIGPILDPTAWMRGTDSLQEQIKFLRAFRAFRAAIEELRPS